MATRSVPRRAPVEYTVSGYMRSSPAGAPRRDGAWAGYVDGEGRVLPGHLTAASFVFATGGLYMLGGSLLVLADSAARTLFSPMQLPVGVLTAMIGVPLFLFLLRRQRRP